LDRSMPRISSQHAASRPDSSRNSLCADSRIGALVSPAAFRNLPTVRSDGKPILPNQYDVARFVDGNDADRMVLEMNCPVHAWTSRRIRDLVVIYANPCVLIGGHLRKHGPRISCLVQISSISSRQLFRTYRQIRTQIRRTCFLMGE
jgi:hypothetical protein